MRIPAEFDKLDAKAKADCIKNGKDVSFNTYLNPMNWLRILTACAPGMMACFYAAFFLAIICSVLKCVKKCCYDFDDEGDDSYGTTKINVTNVSPTVATQQPQPQVIHQQRPQI